MSKITEFNDEAKQGLRNGVVKLVKAVGSTLGARGSHVIFNERGVYAVTKDGVTVAKQVASDNPIEQASISIVREAALRTARDAGDGTTTATILAANMIEKAIKSISYGANGMDLKRGIDQAVAEVVDSLEKSSIPCKNNDDIYNIAKISANNDDVIGKMVGDIFAKVGKNGSIRLEQTQSTSTTTNVVEGCQLVTGALSPTFFNKKESRLADYSNALVLITDKKFDDTFKDLVEAIEVGLKAELPILIICSGMEGEAFGSLNINVVQHKLPVVAVTAPDFGDKRLEILHDIAAMTGGTVMSEAEGKHLKDIVLEDYGVAKRVVVSDKITTIIGRAGDADVIKNRVEEIEKQIETDIHNEQSFRLKNRIASLTGGVGVIYVGGNSEAEMKETYYRLEDAISASKAALEDGIVPGGGLAYLNAASRLKELGMNRGDINLGRLIVRDALRMPLYTIAANTGENADVILNEVLKNNRNSESNAYGYDALTGSYTDLLLAGIIDPVKVVITALKNAASVAGMLITTNCVIVDEIK